MDSIKETAAALTSPLKVEQWPIDRPIEYARNSRKNDAKIDQMAAAIREFGFRIPIVAKSDGSVVDGHLRLKAARKLGLTEVPVALADELTDAQIKAFGARTWRPEGSANSNSACCLRAARESLPF